MPTVLVLSHTLTTVSYRVMLAQSLTKILEYLTLPALPRVLYGTFPHAHSNKHCTALPAYQLQYSHNRFISCAKTFSLSIRYRIYKEGEGGYWSRFVCFRLGESRTTIFLALLYHALYRTGAVSTALARHIERQVITVSYWVTELHFLVGLPGVDKTRYWRVN